MPNYNRDNKRSFSGNSNSRGGYNNDRRSDRGGFGGERGGNFNRNSFGDSDRKEMFDTVCDQCGKDCQVPFKPTGDRPVYCNNCFREREETQDRGGNRSFDDRKPARRFEDKFEPRHEKPVTSNHDMSKMLDQLNSMNSKLEKVLRFIESQAVNAHLQSVANENEIAPEVIENDSEKKPKKLSKRATAKKKKAE